MTKDYTAFYQRRRPDPIGAVRASFHHLTNPRPIHAESGRRLRREVTHRFDSLYFVIPKNHCHFVAQSRIIDAFRALVVCRDPAAVGLTCRSFGQPAHPEFGVRMALGANTGQSDM